MNKIFDYKENDAEGEETLNVIAGADKFNEWMYSSILPYCKGNVLEIGSGIGNISRFFLDNNFAITLSDIREGYVQHLKEKFYENKNLKGAIVLDLVADDFNAKYNSLIGTFDTVYALNVIEHINDDGLALKNCKSLLKEGGNLIILVPAYQFLYNKFDEELFHFRRYSKNQLKNIFQTTKFSVIRSHYFNFAGILGWYVSGKLQKNKTIPSRQMKFYNLLVPFFKIADKMVLNKIGLSVIVVGKK